MVDCMSLAHLGWYIILGIVRKNDYKLALFLSIAWELFEHIITSIPSTKLLLQKHWIIPEKYWNETLTNKITDICFNMLGYYIGNEGFARHFN